MDNNTSVISDDGIEARDYLINTKNWDISDGTE